MEDYGANKPQHPYRKKLAIIRGRTDTADVPHMRDEALLAFSRLATHRYRLAGVIDLSLILKS